MTLNDTKYQKNTNHFDKIGSHDLALKSPSQTLLSCLQVNSNPTRVDASRHWCSPFHTSAAQFHSFSGFFIFGVFQNIFGWGALPPQTPSFGLGGESPPRPSPRKRSSLAFERGGQTGPLDQMLFFGAVRSSLAFDLLSSRPNGAASITFFFFRRR